MSGQRKYTPKNPGCYQTVHGSIKDVWYSTLAERSLSARYLQDYYVALCDATRRNGLPPVLTFDFQAGPYLSE
jgi:hypothetical protein